MATQFNDTTGDHKWSTAGNWSAGVPDAADDVTIGAAVTSLIIDATATCLSLDMTGAASNFVLSGSSALTVAGNVTLKSSSETYTFTGGITITDNCTFTSNGEFLNCNVTANTANKTLTLGDAINVVGFIHSRGTLTTGNNNITCIAFSVGGVNASRVWNLGTSLITCQTFATGQVYSAITLDGDTHTITINSNTATNAASFCSSGWGIVNFNSNASAARGHIIDPGSGATFKQFNIDQLTDRRDCAISFSGGFTATDMTWKSGGAGNDDPTIRLAICSSVGGTARSITCTNNPVFTDIDVQDIKIITGVPTGTRVGDCGGNTNAGCSTPKTVYAACGTAEPQWYDDVWTTTNGADATARNAAAKSKNNFPLPQDTALIDDKTWLATGKWLYVTCPRIGEIDASGLTLSGCAIRWGSLSNTQHFGDMLVPSGHSQGGGNDLTFNSVLGNISIAVPDTISGSYFYIDSYGSYVVRLTAALTTTNSVLILTRGTFDLNGNTLTVYKFSSANSNTRKLQDDVGGGRIVITGSNYDILDFSTDTNLTIEDAPDIQIGTGSVTLEGNVTVYFGNTVKTFGDLTLKKHLGNYYYFLSGTGITFGQITQETRSSTTFNKVGWAPGMFYCSGYSAIGDALYPSEIISYSAGNPAHLEDINGGTNTVTNTIIQDVHVS